MERRAMRPELSSPVGRMKPKALSAITAKSANNAQRYSPYVEISA